MTELLSRIATQAVKLLKSERPGGRRLPFSLVHHFVESFPCRLPLKPALNGQGAFKYLQMLHFVEGSPARVGRGTPFRTGVNIAPD